MANRRTINGNWGPVSRSALRDFKTMNGLPGDDRRDRDTEQALSSRQGVRASATFIGDWAR
jgi:peptidoglycan hydrolase-like protein with peptidoglycan-binding domain